MQYTPESEKVGMINNPNPSTFQPVSLTENREVHRTRKILIIILTVLVVLSVISLPGTIFGFQSKYDTKNTLHYTMNCGTVIGIFLYIFGLVVAYKYHQLGLRIFAWLGVIELIITGILMVLLLILGLGILFAAASLDQEHGSIIAIIGSLGVLFLLFLLAGSFILTLIIVMFAFKLARLIEANKRLPIQQI